MQGYFIYGNQCLIFLILSIYVAPSLAGSRLGTPYFVPSTKFDASTSIHCSRSLSTSPTTIIKI